MKYDEISLLYWENNKIKVGSSKSYACNHNGYVYGDEMISSSVEFVYLDNGEEIIYKGTKDSLKDAYFQMVAKACATSNTTRDNFLNNPAEKFRIYTQAQVDLFTEQKRNSTRIKDDSCRIIINGIAYYVANNLKLCEYFNSASMNIVPEELTNWFIRIYIDDDAIKPMEDTDESELISNNCSSFTITVNPNPINKTSRKTTTNTAKAQVHIDFTQINETRKRIGNIGESIVLDFEKNRLTNLKRADLSEKIEHTSVIKGDGFGYDIRSFSDDGKPLYIEVKTTKHNKVAGFYLSRKELEVANKLHADGENYVIYRVYNLKDRKGTAELAFYKPPFDNTTYEMQAENWKVDIR